MSERAKMLAGQLYRPDDDALLGDQRRAQAILQELAALPVQSGEDWEEMLESLFGGVGYDTVIRFPFRCRYGKNIRAGDRLFVDYDCIFIDAAVIEIGDDVKFGPAVQIHTAGLPFDAEQRRAGLEYARPVRIGNNVWVGGGAILLPGINIGESAIVGAGSVVTGNVPPGDVVIGNPARSLRRAGGTEPPPVPPGPAQS